MFYVVIILPLSSIFVFFKQLLEYFVEEYFDQNPISQVCR